MMKRIARIVILILFPFLLFLSGTLILMPGLAPEKGRPDLEFLKDGENRNPEAGNFRRRLWLDGEHWRFQPELEARPIPIFVPSCWNSLPGLENFYMVGHWVQAGGGLPSGLMTGQDVVMLMCKKDRKKFV